MVSTSSTTDMPVTYTTTSQRQTDSTNKQQVFTELGARTPQLSESGFTGEVDGQDCREL